MFHDFLQGSFRIRFKVRFPPPDVGICPEAPISKVYNFKSVSIMVRPKDVRKVNIIWKVLVVGFAVALAVGAYFYNPGHMFTAGIIAAFGLESKFVKNSNDDIC